MLRSDIKSTPEQVKIQLTQDDIISFYRCITEGSYDKKEYFSGMLTILQKNYFEYILNCLRSKNLEENSRNIKSRTIISKLNILLEKKYFEGKVDIKIVNMIKQDLSDHGNILKSLFKDEDREEFISLLQKINNEIQISLPTIKSYPDHIKTGLSHDEQKNIKFGTQFGYTSLSRTINTEGNQFFSKKQWPEAIKKYQEALAVENNIPPELKIEKDEAAITVYLRNLSHAYGRLAADSINNKSFSDAIEYYRKAIDTLSQIKTTFKTSQDKNALTQHMRNLAHALNTLAIHCYDHDNSQESLKYHKEAIIEFNKIFPEMITEQDQEALSAFKRNLAFVHNQYAMDQHDLQLFENAISNYQSAISAIKDISESKHDGDEAILAVYQRNLSYAFNDYANFFLREEKLDNAIKNYQAAIAIFEAIPFSLMSEDDCVTWAMYMDNYNHAVAEKDKTEKFKQNPFVFFNLKSSDLVLTPSKSEPELLSRGTKRKLDLLY